MKRLIYLSFIIIASCNSNTDKSDAYGTFEATEIMVSPEITGKLLMLKFDEGNSLKKGDTVGFIDSIDWVLKKQQLQAQRKAIASKTENISSQAAVQKQQKENLLFEKNRIEKLLKDGAATQKQMDDMKASLELIEKQIQSVETQSASLPAELESIDKQIAQLDMNIKRCIILNPIDGVVLSQYTRVSEIAVAGKPIYKIADIENMELRVYVSGEQLPQIKIGQKVKVFLDKTSLENSVLEGNVSWISSQAEFTPKVIQTKEERVNLVYAVKVKTKNDGSIKIGMPGEIRFE